MQNRKIGVFVGSLRRESYNKKIAKALISLAPETLALEMVDISRLQFFNEDLENTPPKEWTELREKVLGLDGLLFITPEYNRSVPAVLKNAIDVGSRPYGKSVWSGKPAGVISVSIGAIGGFGANHHLRQSLVFLNVPTLPQPEAYIGNAGDLFDDAGQLTNNDTAEFLKKFLSAFEEWLNSMVVKQ